MEQYNALPPRKMQGYGAINFFGMSSSEREIAFKLLSDALFEKTDDTAIDGLTLLDKNRALPVLVRFLEDVPHPNGASLDAARVLHEALEDERFADLILRHFSVGSRFYRRAAINASRELYTSD